MGFVASSWTQRLLDLVRDRRPATDDTVVVDRPPRRLPNFEWFECSEPDRASIAAALALMRVHANTFRSWPGAGKALADGLAGLSTDTINIGCKDCPAPDYRWTAKAYDQPLGRVKYDMTICASSTNPVLRNNEIFASVFQASIQAIGGTPLDYLSLYWLVVVNDWGRAPTQGGPTPIVRDQMCLGSSAINPFFRAGTFMVWGLADGRLYIGDQVNPTVPAQWVNTSAYLPDWRDTCTP